MNTGVIVAYFLGGTIALGLGIATVVLVVTKGLRNPNPEGPSRKGLGLLVVIGAIVGIAGLVLLIRGIVYVASG
jgi:hypothetical protein